MGLERPTYPLSVWFLGSWLPYKHSWQRFIVSVHTYTHWILISNYNARGSIYTHLLRQSTAAVTDTSSSTNQLQPNPCKQDERADRGKRGIMYQGKEEGEGGKTKIGEAAGWKKEIKRGRVERKGSRGERGGDEDWESI